jgi:hypothetical protein
MAEAEDGGDCILEGVFAAARNKCAQTRKILTIGMKLERTTMVMMVMMHAAAQHTPANAVVF